MPESIVHGGEIPDLLLAAATETPKEYKGLKDIAEMVKDSNQKKTRRWALKEMQSLRPEKSLEFWQSFLERLRGEDGPVEKQLQSKLTFHHLIICHRVVQSFLESCLTQYFQCDEV